MNFTQIDALGTCPIIVMTIVMKCMVKLGHLICVQFIFILRGTIVQRFSQHDQPHRTSSGLSLFQLLFGPHLCSFISLLYGY